MGMHLLWMDWIMVEARTLLVGERQAGSQRTVCPVGKQLVVWLDWLMLTHFFVSLGNGGVPLAWTIFAVPSVVEAAALLEICCVHLSIPVRQYSSFNAHGSDFYCVIHV